MTRAGYFEGNRLMVSHSNEYRAPGGRREGAIDDVKSVVMETAAPAVPRPRRRGEP